MRDTDSVAPRYDVDVNSTAGGVMDKGMAAKPRALVDNHTVPGPVLDPKPNYWISGRAFASPNIAVASVTREVNKEQNEINSDRNTANNSASRNTENNFNPDPTTENNTLFLSLLFLCHSKRSIHMLTRLLLDCLVVMALVLRGFLFRLAQVQLPLGVPIHIQSTEPGNLFVDAVSHCGPPPSVYYYGLSSTMPPGLPLPVPTYPTAGPAAATPYPSASSTLMYSHDAFTHPSSLSMGAAATVTPSSTAATTSGVTTYPSGPFVVGADVFDVQPKPSVPVTTASTLSSAAVTLGPSTQNFVVPGTDAVSGSFIRSSIAVVIRTTPVYRNISYIYKTYIQVR